MSLTIRKYFIEIVQTFVEVKECPRIRSVIAEFVFLTLAVCLRRLKQQQFPETTCSAFILSYQLSIRYISTARRAASFLGLFFCMKCSYKYLSLYSATLEKNYLKRDKARGVRNLVPVFMEGSKWRRTGLINTWHAACPCVKATSIFFPYIHFFVK